MENRVNTTEIALGKTFIKLGKPDSITPQGTPQLKERLEEINNFMKSVKSTSNKTI